MNAEDHVKRARRNTGYLCQEGILVHRIKELKAEREKLIEVLDKLYQATEADFYEIVGRSEDGHPLNALGVARQEARAVLEEVKDE